MSETSADRGARPEEHEFHIQIDRVHFTVRKTQESGLALRGLPTPPIGEDRELYEIRPGESDLPIENAQLVEMHDGLRFFTAPRQINPGA